MNNQRITDAITFAARAHEGQRRKGTDIPYISHPLEAALIAVTLTDDEDTIIATILHDLAEDTNYTIKDIEDTFGINVANLVSYESEDKMRNIDARDSWRERKEHALKHIKSAPLEAKIICLSDKLSNMRLCKKDYIEIGDKMWSKFNQTDKKAQEWYYRSICDVLKEFENTPQWKEYKELCDFVFKEETD